MKGIIVWLALGLASCTPLLAQGHLLPQQTNGTFISGTTYSLDDSRIWGIDIVGSNKGIIDAGLEGFIGLTAPAGIVGDLEVNQIWTLRPFLTVRPINTRLLIAEAMGHFQYSWIDRDEILVEGREPGLTKYAWMAGGMLRTRIELTKYLTLLPAIGGGYLSDRHESFYTSTGVNDQGDSVQIPFLDQTDSDTFYRGELSLSVRTKRGEVLGISPFFERRLDREQDIFGIKISIGTAVWEDLPVLVSQGTDPITSGAPVVAQERAPPPPPEPKSAEELAFEDFVSGIKILEVKASPRVMIECQENPGGLVCMKLEKLAREAGAGRLLTYVDGLQEPKQSDDTICDRGIMNVALGFITEKSGAVQIDYEDCRGRLYPFRKRAEYSDSLAMWDAVFSTYESFLPGDISYDETKRKDVLRYPISSFNTLEKAELKIVSLEAQNDSLSGIYELENGVRLAILGNSQEGVFDVIYMSGAATILDWVMGERRGTIVRSDQFNRYDIEWHNEAKRKIGALRGRQTGGGDFEIRLNPDEILRLTRID